MTPRFIRHFNVVSINQFSDDTMIKIFQTLMQIYLRNSGFSPEYFSVVHPIVASTMEVYKQAIENLLPTPAKSHYTFNLRDFGRVIMGCCLIHKNSVDNKRIFVRYKISNFYIKETVAFLVTFLRFFRACMSSNAFSLSLQIVGARNVSSILRSFDRQC